MEGCGEEERNRSHRPETWEYSHKRSYENPDEAEKKVQRLNRNAEAIEDVMKDIHKEFKLKV
jgi:hypothetical protein